jgi:hypothetical protein
MVELKGSVIWIDDEKQDEDELFLFQQRSHTLGVQMVRHLSDGVRFVSGIAVLHVWGRIWRRYCDRPRKLGSGWTCAARRMFSFGLLEVPVWSARRWCWNGVLYFSIESLGRAYGVGVFLDAKIKRLT